MSNDLSLYTVLPGRSVQVGQRLYMGGECVELSKADGKDFIKLGFVEVYSEKVEEPIEEPEVLIEEPEDRHPLQDVIDAMASREVVEDSSEPDETVFTPSQPEELTFDAEPVPVEIPAETAPVEEVKKAEPEKINLNFASIAEMLTLPVIGPTSAKLIEQHRPYISVESIPEKANLPKATAGRWMQIIDRVTV